MTHETIKISSDDDGQRLDRWLRKKRPDLPYVLIQKLLRKGVVKIDGKRAKSDARLTAGQEVRVPQILEDETGRSRASSAALKTNLERTENHPKIKVLYQDDTLLVIDKPTGLAVQGGSGLRVHLEMLLDDYIVHGVRPRLVHRIDRETSGVLILARTAAAARHLGEQFKGRDVFKTYMALVSPIPTRLTGVIDAPIGKVMAGTDLEKMQVMREGDPAITKYQVRAKVGTKDDEKIIPAALIEFSPKTGRTHQIRVHAAHIGCPLLGDTKYGGDVELLRKIKVKPRVMLHAAGITITHPKTDETMTFESPFPDDFSKSIQKIGLELKV